MKLATVEISNQKGGHQIGVAGEKEIIKSKEIRVVINMDHIVDYAK